MEVSKSSRNEDEEDYIDMELTTSSSISSPTGSSSSKRSREFEFQMSTLADDKETATPCPADELFYKGQLLPLQLPPRLLMVQKLLLHPQQHQPSFGSTKQATDEEDEDDHDHDDQCSRIPTLIRTSLTGSLTNPSTSFQSRNISPAESCRPTSCELNPDEFSIQWSTTTDVSALLVHRTKKSWSNKFSLIKQSALSQKLKASRAYLKSLFIKSAAACSCESSANAKAAEVQQQGNLHPKANDYHSRYIKVGRNIPMRQIDKQVMDEDNFQGPRRSFTGAIKRHCGAKCLLSSTSSSTVSSSNSSSCSVKSNGLYEINLLKRSSSLDSDIESAVEAAIAHCKRSQQQHSLIKAGAGTGSCSPSPAAKVAACVVNAKSELSRI